MGREVTGGAVSFPSPWSSGIPSSLRAPGRKSRPRVTR